MKISLDYPDELDQKVMKKASEDGHKSRAAVIRKALAFYLSKELHEVAFDKKEEGIQNQTATI